MEALTLLLMFFMVSGYSYVLQPRLTITEIAGLDSDADHWSEWSTERLTETSISAEDRGNEEKKAAATFTEERKKEEEQRKEGLTPETNPERETVKDEMMVEEMRREEGLTPETDPEKKRMVEKERMDNISTGFTKTVSENMTLGGETKREEDSAVADTEDGLIEDHLDTDKEGKVEGREDGLNPDDNSEKREELEESRTEKVILADNTEKGIIVKTVNGHMKSMKSGQMEKEKQGIEKEETESKLVAGIGLHEERREDNYENGKKQFNENQEYVEEKGENEDNKEGDSEGKKIAEEGEEKSKKSKVKKGKKGNKTKRPSEEEEVAKPTYFPYFKDNYCPPECACYGRVVQCSDKGVDKVPYGIPYNARYILLMNNHINSIQLDLLSEYVSMEFLVLSNNRLTDGAIEGAFEGVPALKRLYLDRNLLESVPTDLPASLEELCLDNNRLSVMSEAAWARCPGLLVLSLSNNSLGNGSESLPSAVLAPLGNLRALNLDGNQLASVPLGLPLSIKELYLRGNLIQRFRGGAFNGTSELVVLDLSANRLTNKGLLRESLLNATHLESLNLEGNRLKQVPRHLPLSLKTLNLEGNLISSINKAIFLTLTNLEHLGLARNKIFRVAPGAFRALPVLHQLDLCHNALRQVPRQLPRALHSAALTHNKIQSVPRDAFCWGDKTPSLSGLVRVQLEHNLIDLGNLDAQAFRCLRGFQVVHFY
ncbi:podocan [Centroberyx affinis]|uniref:podocan n=1 Tax=Centroberyx affinis TaxID=166261 RepID=UPI003A5C4ABA